MNHEQTPLDEFNEPDFESVEAIDLSLFNEHLVRLTAGEEVEIPTYNFTTGKREYRGRRIKLNPDQPLIIEGIHGLNEQLTSAIPRHRKFKIYISATLSISTGIPGCAPAIRACSGRFCVTPVRATMPWKASGDGLSAARRGEKYSACRKKPISFNSALVYEQAVIKFAESLLKK